MDYVRNKVRAVMTLIARYLNLWSRGKIKPAHITSLSVIGHIPVAWALINCRPVLAAVLLAGFGILDALDGALARVQKSASLSGMFYDAVSDRLKEVIVFSALAIYVYKHIDVSIVWQVVAAIGTSLLVSYVKAKGEMASASASKSDAQKLNRQFGGGLAAYEIRVVALIVGLFFGWIEIVLPLMIVVNSVTIISRFLLISKHLHRLDSETADKAKKTKTSK